MSDFGCQHSGAAGNSSFHTLSSDYTTSYNEVQEVMQEIDARAGPKSTVLVALVNRKVEEQVRAACSEYAPGEVFIETEHTFAAQIACLGSYEGGIPPGRNRLVLVVGPAFESCRVNIPRGFLRAEVIACWKQRKFIRSGEIVQVRDLVLDGGSTYCGIPLGLWATREDHPRHELTPGHGVSLEVFDEAVINQHNRGGDGATAGPTPPPFALQSRSDVDAAAEIIAGQLAGPDAMLVPPDWARSLPWLDLVLDGASNLLSASPVSRVAKVRLSVHGIHVACGSYSAAAFIHRAEGREDAYSARGAAAAGGEVAVEYFIPWGKLASWLLDAFDYFLIFLRSVWAKIKNALSWLKDVLVMVLQFLKGTSVGGTLSSGFSSLARAIGGRQPEAITMPLKMD